MQDIDDTLEFGEFTLSLIPETELVGGSGLAGLSTVWLLRFQCTGALEDIDRAIANQREVLRLSTDDIHLKYFGGLLLGRYRLTNSAEDMEEAIDVLRKAFGITLSNISELPGDLRRIGEVYMDNYYEDGNTYAFANGLTILQEALRRCSPDSKDLPDILESVGTGLLGRFDRGGDINDLNNAISTLLEALERTPSDYPNLHGRLNDAGKALLVRFEDTGDPNDLDRSIDILQKAVEKAPKEGASVAACFSGLGMSLLRLFLLKGHADALEDAVRLLRDSVDLSDGHPSQHIHLSHLGNCLLRRYEFTGNFADIDEAVSVQQAAVKTTLDRHVPLRINLLNLGNAYYSRSLARESVDDMKEAVAVFRKARSLIQNESGKMKPAILDNLSGALGDLFDSVQDPDLLEEALDILTESMTLTEANHPYKPIQLNNFAILLRRRYQFTGNLEDIEAMMEILNDALEHPARTVLTETTANQNITWATTTRFKRTNNIEDLDATIFHHERSLAMIPETHYSYNNSLTSLASVLESRYHMLGTVADLNKAIQLYQQAALNRSGVTSLRLTAATSWARALVRLNEPDALDGYALAIELLPTVAWLGETVSERHNKLSSWSSLVNEAAAAAITWNQLDLAVQWLEEGRSIVWNQLNTFRTPVDDLHDVHPDLADELRHISKELDKLGSRSMKEANRMTLNQKSNVQAEARMQRDLATKWEDVLRKVRMLHGFEDFLRPAKVSKLLKMKRPKGTVVMINVDRMRCDALALRQDSQEIIHIPLSDLTYTKAEALRRLLVSSLTEHGIRSRGSRSGRPSKAPKINVPFEDILNQLWILVVLHIITELGLQPTNSPPRIWWCATGPLAFLPIHAAGIYSGNGAHIGSILSDYVVSSYTPTLNSVFSSVKRNATGVLEKLLVVTQPETPGMLPLPQTVEEGKVVQKKLNAFGHAVEYLEGMKATVGKVIKSMETSSWIHLACHAIQDPKNPTRSAFYFYDGTLELSTLIGKQLPNADFAFLSACETGTGDEKLPEEAVHLAVAKGMEYLHENSVIHGDLKGANVLITDAGGAILCDFGLSTVTLDVDVMAYTSIETIPQSSGTLRYQAPELFAPEDETEPKLTKECDIYSFSCLCYEIFTGKLPFYDVLFEPAVVFQVHSGNRPSRPAANDPSWNYWGLTEDIWAFMGKCWSRIPSLRPSSTDVVHTFGLNVNETHSINNDGNIQSSSAAFRRPLYDLQNLSTAGFNQPDPVNTWTQYSKLSSRPFIYSSGIRVWRARSILTMTRKSGSGSMYGDPSIYSHGTGESSRRDASHRLKAPSIISTALSTLTDDTFYAGRFQNEPYKVLILGAAQTGKSTIVKQLKIAYGGGYTDAEREVLVDIVFQTFSEAVQTVMDYMAEKSIECSSTRGKQNYQDIRYIKSHEGRDAGHIEFVHRLDVWNIANDYSSGHNQSLRYNANGYLGDYQRYHTINYMQSVINLLADPTVTNLLKSDWGKYRLDSSKRYFLYHAAVFQRVDYFPSDEEIIYASRTTSGIWETDLKMRSLHIRIYDVGGARPERKKWINRFASITSVIFCVALDDYYKALAEDDSVNRMHESLTLFESIHSTRWFTGKPTILLLTKFDVFKEIIQRIPLELGDYQGGADVLKGVSFILGLFKDRAASVTKPVYPHLLQATDSRNIRQVFRTVRDEILMTALEDHVNSLRLVD